MNTKQKKFLYESIMKSVAKTVKNIINESLNESMYDNADHVRNAPGVYSKLRLKGKLMQVYPEKLGYVKTDPVSKSAKAVMPGLKNIDFTVKNRFGEEYHGIAVIERRLSNKDNFRLSFGDRQNPNNILEDERVTDFIFATVNGDLPAESFMIAKKKIIDNMQRFKQKPLRGSEGILIPEVWLDKNCDKKLNY